MGCCSSSSKYRKIQDGEAPDIARVVSKYLPPEDWTSPMGLKSKEKTRVEYVLLKWHTRFSERAVIEYNEYKPLPSEKVVSYKQNQHIDPTGMKRRHDYVEPEQELIAAKHENIKSVGNPWGLTYATVTKAISGKNVLPVLEKLGLGGIFAGDQDFGLQDEGFRGIRRKELQDEGSLQRYEFVAALVTFLEILMVLEPPNPKVFKNYLGTAGLMKEKASAGWFLLETLDYIYPLWQDLIGVGEFRLQGIGESLKKATENLLAAPEGKALVDRIPNLKPPRTLRADDYGLKFKPFDPEWKAGMVEGFAKATALMVVCAAELCDDEYQARVRRIVEAQNMNTGELPAIQHTPAPPKKFDRIMNKHGQVMTKNERGMWVLGDDPHADHGTARHPRVACNVDTVRCGLTCAAELAPSLHTALGKDLGVRLRTKNNLLASDKDKQDMFYYLAILDNYEVSFAPVEGGFTGVTHGDVASALRKKGEERFKGDASQIERCHLVASYLEQNHKDLPVTLVCETQIILPMYLEGRKRSHLPYKIVRCKTADELRRDLSSL